ncbi:MAG TPA: hydrogenase maturation nickel metallochaperone HypA [Bacteroidales bacterium]|nr:hydrogenase maturation nickel metallochaperone HypA [Bacteroidales bacterium]
MHEFSIALNIVEIAIETARANDAETVNEVEVDVGDISGVVYEALEFALQSAIKGTILENSHFRLNRIRARVICNECRHDFEPTDFLPVCTKCGSSDIRIVRGKELKVKSINID